MKAQIARLSAYALLFVTAHEIQSLSNLTKNDPYPVYTSADPYAFMRSRYKQELQGGEYPIFTSLIRPRDQQHMQGGQVYGPHERLRLSFSVFRQSSKWGTNVDFVDVPLGDLEGRWNVLGLFYPESNGNTEIQQQLFAALDITQAEQDHCFSSTGVDLANPDSIDARHEFGFFSVPIKYRKHGVRFELNAELHTDWMLQIQTGVSDIRQTVTFIDLTCTATGLSCPVRDCVTPAECSDPLNTTPGACINENCCIDVFDCACKKLVINKIMDQFECVITPTLGLNSRDFHKTAMEDTRVSVFLSHLWDVNTFRGPTWARFLFTPFIAAQVNIPTGRKSCPRVLFDLPSGNDGYWGFGFTSGCTIDFLETVMIAVEAGMTKWNTRTVCDVPVATNCQQSGVFPRLADLRVTPGTNWNFNATLSAYHFLERLSFYAQFVLVDHSEDCIKLISTTASTPETLQLKKMRELSAWQSMFVNSAFNYDISPNIALGILWQAPVKRRNAYYSTTVLGSLVITY